MRRSNLFPRHSYYTTDELAKRLGVNFRTLKQAAEEGKIPCIKQPFSGAIFYPRKVVDTMFQEYLNKVREHSKEAA